VTQKEERNIHVKILFITLLVSTVLVIYGIWIIVCHNFLENQKCLMDV